MFSEQVKAFSAGYRCVIYDHRGQSRSEVTRSGYDMDTLTEDAAAVNAAIRKFLETLPPDQNL